MPSQERQFEPVGIAKQSKHSQQVILIHLQLMGELERVHKIIMNEPYRLLSAKQAAQSVWDLDSSIDVERLQELIDRASALPSCLTLFVDVFKTSRVWPIDTIVSCIDRLSDTQCSNITLRSAYQQRLTDLMAHPTLQ